MKNLRNLTALALLSVLISGCASLGGPMSDRMACIVSVAGAGGVAGAAGAQNPAAAAVGLATGALAGAFICGRQDSDGDGVPDDRDKCPDTPKGVKVDAQGCPLDSDGDGVPDYKDKCPDTPKGTPVNADGCPLDSDGDGVTDNLDQCPGTPKGVSVDRRGCPLDSDGDGVPDYQDKCPDTPEGVHVDRKGCPLCNEKLFVLNDVNFAFNKATLTSSAKGILDRAVHLLQTNKQVSVRIVGYTDNVGSEAYNLKLSKRRAEAARDYLVAHGISSARLASVGKGESSPIASNTTAKGRGQNRRVEFVVSCNR